MIEYRPVTTIAPYWRNPRIANQAVTAVQASIERFGFLQPILVDTNNVIVAGHTRYAAALRLNLDQVPTITLDLPEARLREYRIIDNRTAEYASWDDEGLISQLAEWDPTLVAEFFPIHVEDPAIEVSSNGIDEAPSDLPVPKRYLCPACLHAFD